jgi:homoserine O-acetyltransferase/O-succinyltransferase
MVLGGGSVIAAPGEAAPARYAENQGDVVLHDYVLRDGERFPDLRLHYTSLGTPQRDAAGHVANAVLLLHGTTGSGRTFLQPTLADNLFGPGQVLDAQRFFVILPDGIGAGGSSKPADGLGGRFPHYGYMDQVETQHALAEQLGATHLRLVCGTSMGGMQTWLWAERYPDAADLDVPIASQPAQISGRNLMWRQMVVAAVHNDPAYHGGAYDQAHPPQAWAQVVAPLFAMMVGTPARLQHDGADRARTLAYDDGLIAAFDKRDPNEIAYVFASSADYDPAPRLDAIRAPLVAINFADDEINPAGLPGTAETVKKIPGARFVLLPGGYGHNSLTHGDLWAATLAQAMQAHGGSPPAGH